MPRPAALPRLLTLLLLLLVGASTVHAQTLPDSLKKALRDDNPVVAVVNGTDIRWNEVVLSALDLPAEYQSQVQAVFPALLGRMIDMQLIADQARALGIDRDPAVQARLKQAENELLREHFLTDFLGAQVSDADVQERVEVLTAGTQREEVRLSIIVTVTGDQARSALARINAGEAFALVASAVSIDRSATAGGDLGFFAEGELQPAQVATEAFALKPGQHSRQPIMTDGGWVLVKVTERRMSEPLSKAEIAQRIRRELTRLALDKLLVELRGKATIDLFPEQ